MIIWNNQSTEWKWKSTQLAIAQAQFDRYHEIYPEPDFDISLHVYWDKLDEQAEQATLEEFIRFDENNTLESTK